VESFFLILGVAQLLNKKGAHSFDENDEAMFEVCFTFISLNIFVNFITTYHLS